MENTLKSCIGEGKGNLRITNKIYSNEFISEKKIISCIFIDVAFENCQFESVNFDCTVFSQCKFDQCSFSGSNFDGAEIRRCKFNNSKFIKSQLTDLEIKQVTFDCCQFEEVWFARSYIENSFFSYTEFQNMDTRGSSAIIKNSKISIKNSGSILFDGSFDFDQILKFLTSA